MKPPRQPDTVASSELMGVILEGMREAVVATDTAGNIVYANQASRELLGISLLGADEDVRRAQAQPLHEDRQTPVPEEHAPLVRALRGEHVHDMVQWIRTRPDGAELLLSINAAPLFDAAGAITGAVAWFRDITESKRMENELRRLAMTDPLTGAFNRRHGQSRLAAELHRRERYGTSVSVLLADIDHFKSINDRLGHEAGDRALQNLVSVAGTEARTADSIVRWGGEEFLLILPETPLDGAAAVAERLRAAVASAGFAAAGGEELAITLSIGAAEADGADPDTLIRRADEALYRAKQGGRNRVVVARSDDGGR